MVIEEKDNENSDYANLNYIVIDDPITSLGEEKITAVAYDISNSILRMVSSLRKNGKEVGILIMTLIDHYLIYWPAERIKPKNIEYLKIVPVLLWRSKIVHHSDII